MATRDETRDYYDRHFGEYDAKTRFGIEGGHTYNFEKYYQPLLDEILPRSGRVLEIGCGTGFYTRWLVERGLEVVAMDLSPKMVEHARRRCPEGTRLVVGDCQEPGEWLDAESAERGFDVINFHNISLVGGPGILEMGQALKLYMAHEHWLICPSHVLWRHQRHRIHDGDHHRHNRRRGRL